MTRFILSAVFSTLFIAAQGQAIFAHNDYVKPNPFYNAFDLKASYIESDIFLENGSLLVAHTKGEIDPSKTLESLYLRPLSEKVKKGGGSLYGVTLMIDLKTEGTPTMDALVKVLEKYPELTSCKSLFITISGSYPPPSEWTKYPAYITFDGRPNVGYTTEQLKKTRLISTSFASVSRWDGKGEIPAEDLAKMKQVIDAAHKAGKPVRFWASPDFENAWKKFIDAGVDILNSDHIDELHKFLSR